MLAVGEAVVVYTYAARMRSTSVVVGDARTRGREVVGEVAGVLVLYAAVALQAGRRVESVDWTTLVVGLG